LLKENGPHIIWEHVEKPSSIARCTKMQVAIVVKAISNLRESLRQIKRKEMVLGTIVGQLKALRQGKAMAVKRQHQVEVLSQHDLSWKRLPT
jgi:hypothetical protein